MRGSGRIAALLGPVYDQSPVPVMCFGISMKISYFNEAAEKFLSIRLGDCVSSVLPCLVYNDFDALWDSFAVGALPVSFVSSTPVSSVASAQAAFFPICYGKRQTRYILCKVTGSERMDLTVAALSHELRTPVSIISSAANLLGKSESLAGPEHQYVDIISNNCLKLLRLTNNLTDSMRNIKCAESLNLENVDLSDMLTAICGKASQLAVRGRVEVIFRPPASPLITLCDYDKLERAILNLLSNAIKYGGTHIRVKLLRRGNLALIRVTDDGIGIDPQHIGRITEPFYTVAENRLPTSCGLGLYIVLCIVKSHGGKLTVLSTPGKGSTFTIQLPIEQGIGDALHTPSESYGVDHYSPVMLELAPLFHS